MSDLSLASRGARAASAGATNHHARLRTRPGKTVVAAAVWLLLACGAASAQTSDRVTADTLVVTASNTSTNQLMFFNASGQLLKQVATEGQGGVSGNAGGIAATRGRLAVVNFGSSNVSVFARDDDGRFFHLEKIVPTQGSPVSVAFGNAHLYILTTTQVESHPVAAQGVATAADGATALLHADGTAAQVGAIKGQLIVTEKSNAIETVHLDSSGAIAGNATLVANIPANVDAPFGLATRGNEAYVTIAHANEISLVRDATVLTVTGSGTQSAPCWVALDGPFLFSSNSPSKSISRYAVYGQQIVQDAAVAAQINGNPTDIAYRAGLAAVVDSDGTASHVSMFAVDEDGNLNLGGIATLTGTATNGVAIIPRDGK